MGAPGPATPYPWPPLGSYGPNQLMLMTQIIVPSSNKLRICNFLVELRCIHRLERVLIARRLQFKKVTVMLKDQSHKFKAAICNVPVDIVSACNTLSHPANINGLGIVKLKRKMEYRGHVKVPH